MILCTHRATLALLTLSPALAQEPWRTLDGPGLAEWSLLGTAMDLDGPHLFVGAPLTCAPTQGSPVLPGRGTVAVYQRQGTAWSSPTLLQSSTGHVDDAFGISVAVSGDLAFVGASGDDAARDRAGAVYVFARAQGGWTEVQRLTASDAVTGDGFGGAVAYDNGRLLVGAPLEGHGHVAEWGEAYVFERQNGAFVETAKFRPSTARRDDWFGYRVDLRGDRAAISAYSDGANGHGAGAVWLFEYDGQEWREVQRLLPSDGHAYAHFGVDVRLADNEVVASSHRSAHEGGIRGAVYVFRPDASGWREVQKIQPVGLPDLAAFGASIAYSERGTLLIGAPGADFGRGRVYEFERAPSGSYELARIIAPDGLAHFDYCGMQVRGAAGEVVASAIHGAVGGLRTGRVMVAVVGGVESTRPYCEAPRQATGARAELALLGAAVAGQDITLNVTSMPPGCTGFLSAALPGAPAPAAFGSCLVGPTRTVATFVADQRGAAAVSVPAQHFGGWLQPGATLHLEARARVSAGAPAPLARTEAVRSHALALCVRP